MGRDENIFRIVFAVIFFASLDGSAFTASRHEQAHHWIGGKKVSWCSTLLRLGGLAAGVAASAYLINPAGQLGRTLLCRRH